MSLIDYCIFHSEAGSAGDWTTPAIGGPCTVVGAVTYPPGRFENGSYSGGLGKYISANDFGAFIDKNNFVFEKWLITDDNVVNGKPSTNPVSIFDWRGSVGPANNILQYGLHPTLGLYMRVRVSGVDILLLCTDPSLTWLAGTEQHLIYVYSQAGIAGGTDRFRIYHNGILIYNSVVTPSIQALSGTSLYYFENFEHSLSMFAIVDNPKWYDSTTQNTLDEIIANMNNPGFPVLGIPIPEKTLRERPEKIIVAGIDIHKRNLTLGFPDFTYYKTFDKDLSIINSLSIPVINDGNYFSLDNPVSPFNKTNWKGESVECIDQDKITIWEGILANIKRDHEGEKFSLESKSNLYLDRYTFVDYQSADWEDGATAFENICTAYDITNLNQKNIKIAKDYLVANDCYIKVNVALTDKKNLMAVLEEIANHSSADFYFEKGEVVFQTWRPNTLLSVNIELKESDLLSAPSITIPDKYIVNEYAIIYDGGGPATANIGQSSRDKFGIRDLSNVSGDGIVTFKDIVSARFVGNQQIYRRHKNFDIDPDTLQLISFDVSLDIREYFTLDTFFRMNFSPEAWVDKSFEVFKLHYKYSQNHLGIEAFEVAS